jgi:hypothetical protein
METITFLSLGQKRTPKGQSKMDNPEKMAT